MTDFTPPPSVHEAPHGPVQGTKQPSLRRARGWPRSVKLIGWLGAVTLILVVMAIVWDGALERRDGAFVPAAAGTTGTMHPAQVVPGMCLVLAPQGAAIGEVRVVDCSTRHRAEAVIEYSFLATEFPGSDAAVAEVGTFCAERMVPGVALPDTAVGAQVTWVAWVPTEQTWERGDRTGLCVAVSDEDLFAPLAHKRGALPG
jgi:hypothetical protein